MTTVAAVPVKDLRNAKQRLIPVLEAPERRALARAMLEDVLDALTRAAIDAVYVVTRDPEVLELADSHGVDALVEPGNRGHTEAVALAQREACARRARRFLTIPGDVPCVTPAELAALCAALPDGRAVALVPSRSAFGTNAALLAPPDVMPLKFGEPSFGNHLESARERNLAPIVLRLPGLALDVDAPEDLVLLLADGARTRSAALLRGLGVAERLARRP